MTIRPTGTSALGADKCLEIAQAIVAMREEVAAKHLGLTAPLSAEQIKSVVRLAAYSGPRNALLIRFGISDKDHQELAYAANHIEVAEAVAAEERPVRDIKTPKGFAKAVREVINPKSEPAVELAGAEDLDKVERDAAALMGRLSVERQARVLAHVNRGNVAGWHELSITSLYECWQEVSRLMTLSGSNAKPWAEPKGAFLKPMSLGELLKTDDVEAIIAREAGEQFRARRQNALLDVRLNREQAKLERMRARNEKLQKARLAKAAAKKAAKH